MSFEKPQANNSENVIDLAAVRREKEGQKNKEGKESREQKSNLITSLEGYQNKFETESEKLNELLESDSLQKEDERIFIQQQIKMNKREVQRILFTIGRYQPAAYEEKVDTCIKEFQDTDSSKRNEMKARLEGMTDQLHEFIGVFKDYDLQEELTQAENLRSRIFDTLLT